MSPKNLIILGSMTISLVSFGQGLVSHPNQRTEILAGIDAIFAREPIDVNKVKFKRKSPFEIVSKAPVQKQVVVRPDEPQPPPVLRLSESEALTIAAQNFKPAGSLITSTRRVLRLEGGRMVNEGHTFAVSIRGERYDVVIDSVSEDGYVLRLGEATLLRKFIEATDRVQRGDAN